MKYKSFFLGALSIILSCTVYAQVSYDKIFVNNCAVLNMIPTTSDSHDYKDVVLIAGLAIDNIGDYSSVVVERVVYKEKFGTFAPTDDIKKVLIALNDDQFYRLGRAQVKKDTPKQIWIYPEYSAGSVWVSSDSSASSLSIPFDGKYVLVYNPSSSKNTFYMGDGSVLEGSYANLDGKGRITEIYYGGGYTLKGFNYQVSYNENGKIASIEEIEWIKGSKGVVTKKVKSSVKLVWKGNEITKITIAPKQNESKEYQLEVKETNAAGLWTKAIISHADDNSAGGWFVDGEYRRIFMN